MNTTMRKKKNNNTHKDKITHTDIHTNKHCTETATVN